MVLHIARKLAATVLGQDPKDPMAAQELKDAGVPVCEESCRTCSDPCDEGHEEFSKRFDVDMETDMRGTVKPYRRQVLISTGKADWVHDVTSESNTLANFISSAEDSHQKSKETTTISVKTPTPTGVYDYTPTSRLSILNASHHSISEDPDTHATILVLPDFVAVSDIPITSTGADAFWRYALDPGVSRAGTSTTEGEEIKFKSWTLPYNCVILLCSHKRRDARCHIASQRLEQDFARSLESEGWQVDTDLDAHDITTSSPPLESIASTDEERLLQVALEQLHAVTSTGDCGKGRVLMLKNSHIGGHKYAGNVIIYFPQGSSIWYGRVTPHHVQSIVQHTILGGKILPQLFRGGLGIVRSGDGDGSGSGVGSGPGISCKSLLDW